MDEKEQAVLQAIAKFEPISDKELEACVVKCDWWEVEHQTDTLQERGFVTINDEDEFVINRDPFNSVPEEQMSLDGSGSADEQAVIDAGLPDGIETEATTELELNERQALLFEKMRADVSRVCGEMSREEFMDWVLREARRMTEV